MRVTTYNPKEVTCALGNHIMSGFADDSFITVEPAGDGTSYVSGADGEIARSIDPSKIYTVKIALLQASSMSQKQFLPGEEIPAGPEERPGNILCEYRRHPGGGEVRGSYRLGDKTGIVGSRKDAAEPGMGDCGGRGRIQIRV